MVYRRWAIQLMLALALLGAPGCGNVESSTTGDSGVVAPEGGAETSVPDAALDSAADVMPDDAPSVCHTLGNSAPVVRAVQVDGPFPKDVGAGGSFTSGRYFLTEVSYYSESDAAPGGDAGPIDVWWRTTIDLNVTLGVIADRTWMVDKDPSLASAVEHRENLLFADVSATSIRLQSQCSDWPVDVVAEYTATGDEFRLWIPSVREEVYVRQD